jgi:hypothetical protein
MFVQIVLPDEEGSNRGREMLCRLLSALTT